MVIRFQKDIKIRLDSILEGFTPNVPEEELKREIRSIVRFWAERRLEEDGWPLPHSTEDIREYLLENGLVSEKLEWLLEL